MAIVYRTYRSAKRSSSTSCSAIVGDGTTQISGKQRKTDSGVNKKTRESLTELLRTGDGLRIRSVLRNGKDEVFDVARRHRHGDRVMKEVHVPSVKLSSMYRLLIQTDVSAKKSILRTGGKLVYQNATHRLIHSIALALWIWPLVGSNR